MDGPQAGREYVRDALGRIVVERDTATGAETRIAYDGAARAAIIHPSGEVERFVPGLRLDEHLMRVLPDGSQQFFHQDRSGNTYLVTDGSAQPLEWYRYTAYGEASILSPAGVRLGASAIGNRFTYQGQLADHALGLVDMRARHYLPTWGRFLSRDPLGLLAGSNAYAFVDSSPLIYTDPLGLAKVGRGSDICVVSCHDQTPAPGLEGGWRLTHPADVLNRVWGAAVAAYQYAKGVERGMANGAMDAAVGLYTAVRHPLQTLEGIGHAVTNPGETLSLLWQATKSTGKAIFIDGDPDAAGRVLFEVGLTLFTAGAGHVSKVDKAADLGRLADKGADASRAAGRLNSSNALSGVERASPELLHSVGQRRSVNIVAAGSEEMRYLDAVGAEANVGGANMNHILLRPDPSKAAVLEEFLHGTQHRLGIIDRLGISGAEWHVKDFMIRHARLLGLGAEDVERLIILRDSGL